MPIASIVLLVPSAFALAFFAYVLAKPRLPAYSKKRFAARITFSVFIIFVVTVMLLLPNRHGSPHIASMGLKHNSQIKAIISLVRRDYGKMLAEPKRKVPLSGQIGLTRRQAGTNFNVIIVVLEGVQYSYTSLAGRHGNITPYLASLAEQGVEFTNARSSLSHTTKALFALMTGRFPSASQDIAEAVPVGKPYASVATFLSNNLNYRTAFFQSAMGSFESRPGLVANLGFGEFWSRDDLGDPNNYIGYLSCDEFSMLEPIIKWIKSDEQPFFLAFLCSVTHDPYEVPEWYGIPDKEPAERYKQAITYTDKFLEALDIALSELSIKDKTILCVVGDHGEAFGEHGQHGHALIAFDEVLRIPFCLRAPFFIEPGTKINKPVSSIDLTPTLLSLLGLETEKGFFDGIDLLGDVPDDRRVYFSGWMQEGPAGYVQGDRKVIYDSTSRAAYFYELDSDPMELIRMELLEEEESKINEAIISWRSSTILKINQARTGKKVLYDNWLCRWTNRTSSAKYIREEKANHLE
jgi:phosphoglycerol transferase MdoB-like AlkP superfamily enzyme